jgi:hypothetical protein
MILNTWENVAHVHLTNSYKQSQSWEADSILAGQEIP